MDILRKVTFSMALLRLGLIFCLLSFLGHGDLDFTTSRKGSLHLAFGWEESPKWNLEGSKRSKFIDTICMELYNWSQSGGKSLRSLFDIPRTRLFRWRVAGYLWSIYYYNLFLFFSLIPRELRGCPLNRNGMLFEYLFIF